MPEIYFPQLSSGTLAQYPITRNIRKRTIVNELADGSMLKLSDPNTTSRAWQLRYSGITDAERQSIDELFRTVEGRLGRFVFLDPCSNLLRWSERLDKSTWQKGGGLQVVGGVADERGTETAWKLTNTAQAPQSIRQDVSAPSWFTYCFSMSVRSAGRVEFRLRIEDGVEILETHNVSDNRWQVFQCSGSLGGDRQKVSFSLEVDAGGLIEVSSLQVSAQPYAGSYLKTTDSCGVTSVRFTQDYLRFTSEGIDDHSVTLSLEGLGVSVNG